MWFLSIEGGFYLGNYKQQYHMGQGWQSMIQIELRVWKSSSKYFDAKGGWNQHHSPGRQVCAQTNESFGDIGSETEFIRSGYNKLCAFWNIIWYYMISMYRYVQYTFQCKKRAENRKMKKKRPVPIERPGNEPMAQWPRSNDRASRWLWRLRHWLFAMVEWWVGESKNMGHIFRPSAWKKFINYTYYTIQKPELETCCPDFYECWQSDPWPWNNLDSSHMFTPCHFG